MKRKATIISLALAIVMMLSSIVFADGPKTISNTTAKPGELVIVDVIPSNGETGKQISNMAIKIKFSENMANVDNDAANARRIYIEDAIGAEVEYKIFHHSKYPDELWLVIESDLKSDTEYTVLAYPGIVADSGNATAGDTFTTTFKTRNTKTDGGISTLLMVGMMVIMVLTTRNATKQQEASKDKGSKPISNTPTDANPYKLAKARGISVDEAKAEIEKERAKNARKNQSTEKAREKAREKAALKEAEIEKRVQEILDAKNHKVKAPGSVRAHGGKIPKEVQKRIDRYKKHPRK